MQSVKVLVSEIPRAANERRGGAGDSVIFFAKPNDVTYNSLIDVCVRVNKMHKAWALLKEMQVMDGVSPDNFTYSTLIKGIKPDSLAE